ncbi:MAG: flagellar basal body rod protein FlgC [Desulfuromonadales bacterium]|uniref:flagellar basal body rod protein FlgC n=1 Tax=Desulfuromonas sp. KJ2020 TaxID=2919173 RepID=UPI000320CC10|nr:flagellar basal body rod protein FlgC [Desulfuromonas sp. KJ2020]MCP3178387.1 flagellar basal body rod protein FlgC [Desulfuromonas sp. KJ2020]MDW7645427.1 flagellar basal body rod protein FlgC [Desulfuromonadales bacterium]MDW7757275.1 flagellar basal body rod protein FlgC [Desulfuromonadales bacterium]
MDVFQSLKIGASALKAQQTRLNTISSNLANIETTRTPEGGPYQRRTVQFQSADLSFAERLEQSMRGVAQGVEVTRIVTDPSPPRMVYNPAHPDAGEDGYVAMPDINLMEEMTDMMTATRAYEANITTIKTAKRMALKALEIGR